MASLVPDIFVDYSPFFSSDKIFCAKFTVVVSSTLPRFLHSTIASDFFFGTNRLIP
jgi:hypothetical protein